MKIFSDIGAQLPQSFFIDEFDRLNEMEGISTESQRGVYFDYFIGLLFAQMDGVNIFVKNQLVRGKSMYSLNVSRVLNGFAVLWGSSLQLKTNGKAAQ